MLINSIFVGQRSLKGNVFLVIFEYSRLIKMKVLRIVLDSLFNVSIIRLNLIEEENKENYVYQIKLTSFGNNWQTAQANRL